MSFYAHNLQVGSDGKSQAFGNPEDVGCRLTKYWVLLENEANNQTQPRRHVIGRENAAFALDGENDGDLTIPRFLTNTSATQRPNDEVKPYLNSVAEKNNKIPKSDGVLRQAQPGCMCNHDVQGSHGLDTRGVSAKDAKLRRTRSHGDVPRLSNKSRSGGLEPSQGVDGSSQTCPVCSDSRLDPRFSLASTISPDQSSDDRYDDWRLSLDQFTSKRFGDKRKSSGFSKGLRSFYKKQDNLVVELEELRNDALKTES